VLQRKPLKIRLIICLYQKTQSSFSAFLISVVTVESSCVYFSRLKYKDFVEIMLFDTNNLE